MLLNGSAFQRDVLNKETGRKSTYIFLADVSIVPIVPKVPNVSNVPKIGKKPCGGDTCDTRDIGDIGDAGDIQGGERTSSPSVAPQKPTKAIRIIQAGGYRTNVEVSPGKWSDHLFDYNEVVEVEAWRAKDLIDRGIAKPAEAGA
jgi:hypothetical protein